MFNTYIINESIINKNDTNLPINVRHTELHDLRAAVTSPEFLLIKSFAYNLLLTIYDTRL